MIRILLLIFLVSPACYAQVPPGIYIVHKLSKKNRCEQEIKMFFGNDKLCISKKPILEIEEIEYVSDILYDPKLKINFINVGLSRHGVSTLNKIYTSMPGYQLALVIESRALGRFTLKQEVNRNLNIGHDLDLNSLRVVQDKLKKYSVK